ncbi:uncharacterized protein LOC129004437 [Macrosteles quadrilineatus]|uniref:uncharacterized protein LOC129004408 n=1 Tax=Macrosteles quadrilineatus TaxID=74068 RepID=UPI0023E318E6|nr:uncharacterized protein LOC129004408 [Macrosteles quadrilineatus]XP_054288997.1 uncharacterized protein LOC129004437 [Macrosteles quadrilineatus]
MCCHEFVLTTFVIYNHIVYRSQAQSLEGFKDENNSTQEKSEAEPLQLDVFSEEQNQLDSSENLTQSTESLFGELRAKGLYYNFQNILHDININKLKTGLVDLMHVHNRSEWIYNTRKEYQARDRIQKKKRMIFINVESVYNSKREMITKAVARRLRGRHMTTPPKFMRDIRLIIGTGAARRLYYSLTKYSTANHVRQVLSTHAVVLERYWLHHAAFSIGKHFNTTEELPPLGHPIYKWPSDLLVPDVLFFINATKTPYALGFNQPYTDFTDRLIEVYRRAEGVKVVELNPNRNYPNIVRQIINYVVENYRHHPDIHVPDFDVQLNVQAVDMLNNR